MKVSLQILCFLMCMHHFLNELRLFSYHHKYFLRFFFIYPHQTTLFPHIPIPYHAHLLFRCTLRKERCPYLYAVYYCPSSKNSTHLLHDNMDKDKCDCMRAKLCLAIGEFAKHVVRHSNVSGSKIQQGFIVELVTVEWFWMDPMLPWCTTGFANSLMSCSTRTRGANPM